MWKNVIGGYKRVAGQSNWAVRNRIPAVISIHALSSVCRQNTSDHVTGALLVTWHLHREHQLPLAEYNTCRACHSLGLSKAPLLSWENPFSIINMFSSQLVPNILLKDGRKKVCPPIHPGENHNQIYSLQTSTLRFSNPVRDVAGMKAALPDKTEMMSVPLAFANLISLIGSFHHGVCCSGTI